MLELKEDFTKEGRGEVYIEGISEYEIRNSIEAFALVKRVQKKFLGRTNISDKMEPKYYTIFSFTIERKDKISGRVQVKYFG